MPIFFIVRFWGSYFWCVHKILICLAAVLNNHDTVKESEWEVNSFMFMQDSHPPRTCKRSLPSTWTASNRILTDLWGKVSWFRLTLILQPAYPSAGALSRHIPPHPTTRLVFFKLVSTCWDGSLKYIEKDSLYFISEGDMMGQQLGSVAFEANQVFLFFWDGGLMLPWNLPCSPGWPWAVGDSPASDSLVRGL